MNLWRSKMRACIANLRVRMYSPFCCGFYPKDQRKVTQTGWRGTSGGSLRLDQHSFEERSPAHYKLMSRHRRCLTDSKQLAAAPPPACAPLNSPHPLNPSAVPVCSLCKQQLQITTVAGFLTFPSVTALFDPAGARPPKV